MTHVFMLVWFTDMLYIITNYAYFVHLVFAHRTDSVYIRESGASGSNLVTKKNYYRNQYFALFLTVGSEALMAQFMDIGITICI